MNRIELLYFPRPYTKKLLSEEFHHTKSLDTEEENLNIIDKYIRSKVIKKFIVSIEKDEDGKLFVMVKTQIPYSSENFFAHNAGQGHHNVDQNRCIFRGIRHQLFHVTHKYQ
uniref:Uncharacterized protein n=1 Tax=Rhizophagus irregularis (strain DAOM 181602 / DAOM 197198 / MUCL 43194) TaxID=747089 RepID=U9TBR3_RHIID